MPDPARSTSTDLLHSTSRPGCAAPRVRLRMRPQRPSKALASLPGEDPGETSLVVPRGPGALRSSFAFLVPSIAAQTQGTFSLLFTPASRAGPGAGQIQIADSKIQAENQWCRAIAIRLCLLMSLLSSLYVISDSSSASAVRRAVCALHVEPRDAGARGCRQGHEWQAMPQRRARVSGDQIQAMTIGLVQAGGDILRSPLP